jgi:hypothetical protein
MARGRKTGGRTAGTPNKRTAEVVERLEALGCDPIEGMARLAMDAANAPELRGRMFSELAQYVAPKRKAIEHSAADGGHFEFSWMSAENSLRSLSSEELIDKVLEQIAGGEVEPEAVVPLMAQLRSLMRLPHR